MGMNSSNQNDQAYLLDRMKSLLPIANLSTDIHHYLLEYAKLSSFPRGQHFLIPSDADREYVYLLDGGIRVKEIEATGLEFHAGEIVRERLFVKQTPRVYACWH